MVSKWLGDYVPCDMAERSSPMSRKCCSSLFRDGLSKILIQLKEWVRLGNRRRRTKKAHLQVAMRAFMVRCPNWEIWSAPKTRICPALVTTPTPASVSLPHLLSLMTYSKAPWAHEYIYILYSLYHIARHDSIDITLFGSAKSLCHLSLLKQDEAHLKFQERVPLPDFSL